MRRNQWKRGLLAVMTAAMVLAAGCRAHQTGPGLSAADSNSGGSSKSDGNSSRSTEGTSKSETGSSKASAASSGGSSAGLGDSSQASSGSTGPTNESSRGSSATTEGSSRSTENSSAGSGSKSQASQNSQSSGTHSNSAGLLASTATLVVTVGVIGLAVWVLNPKQDKPAGQAAQSYLKANGIRLRQDLALGAGSSVEDLAAAAEIRPENLGRFGRILQANREELWALGEPAALSPERALRLLARIGELAKTDPALYADYQAFCSRHGVDG